MAGKNVQFRSVESVLKAFRFSKETSFAIWHEKDLNFRHVGASQKEAIDVLTDYLDMIDESNAIYTLKVYEVDGDKLNERTPCTGSFNFRLHELTDEDFQERGSRSGNSEVLSRLKAIEEKLVTVDDEDEPDAWDRIGQVLENPTLQPMIAGLLGSIFGGQGKPAAIAGPPAGMNENDLLQQAVTILRAADAKFPEHLYKLAELSRNNPGQFNMLIGMLDKM